jgi:hypothetical protein
MSNNNSKPKLLWWIIITVAAGCIVFMVISTVRSITKVLREPASPPPVMALTDTPDHDHAHNHAEIKTPGVAVPAPQQQRKPHKNNITTNFEQSIRAEQERKQSYQILREQAQANPGQLGTLTEEEIRKLEKDGETGDSGYP